MTAPEACSGRIIADLYRLEEPLGRGGMGSIWRAQQLRLDSKVAIKLLDPAIADDPETYNRFVREAQSAAAVRSAHVVQIFDCGVDEGTPYISMELLRGESLDKRLAARAVLAPAELDSVFTEVARAVDTAHELGVIHRDLKPGNVFLARERDREIAKVLDFGIAKLMHSEADTAVGTRTGTMLGTPYYMSPEQVRGRRDLDQRTDLWSLAVIAFECLTGQVPFRGDSMGDIVVRICTSSPPPPSRLASVPAGFDDWFAKGTSKDPNARFATAREMAERLSEILACPLAARSGRDGAEAMTLVSTPEPRATGGAAPQQARPAERRGRTGTAVLSESARLPPPASTGSLTTLTSTVSGPARPGSRARWLWVAASVSFVCGASALALRGESDTSGERWPGAASAPEAQPEPPRAPVVGDGAALVAAARPVTTIVAPLEPEPPAAPPVQGEPFTEPPRELAVSAASAEPTSRARELADPVAIVEPPSRPRRARAKAASASRASARSSARRSPASAAKKAKLAAARPESAPRPAAASNTAQVPSEVDPFAERH